MFLALALAAFGLKLCVVYRTSRHADQPVPVMDGAVVPPALLVLGLVLIDRAGPWPNWPPWLYVTLWLFAAVVSSAAIAAAAHLRPAERDGGVSAPSDKPRPAPRSGAALRP